MALAPVPGRWCGEVVVNDGVRSGGAAAGLSAADAEERRRRDGPNRLPEPKRPSGLRRFVGELVHFFAVMLWVAGVLALAAGMPALGFAIFGVIVVNAVFSFVQEHRADVAAQRLRQLLPTLVTVRRSGRPVVVDASDVVMDDVLLVEAGDRVPADARVVNASCLLVDTSLSRAWKESSANNETTTAPAAPSTVKVITRALGSRSHASSRMIADPAT